MAPKPQQARIQEVAPLLRALVEQHEDNTYIEGVEALNAKMMGLIEGADLVDEEVKHTSKVGTHPDNREGAMILPMDSQDLLLIFLKMVTTKPSGMPLHYAFPRARLEIPGGPKIWNCSKAQMASLPQLKQIPLSS